ncbi:MAG: HAMP domain-containing histidine kinase [Acetatifactor sp.]|nr:HAMP domain-containing histidine kinase [Acetatifactor sp.]
MAGKTKEKTKGRMKRTLQNFLFGLLLGTGILLWALDIVADFIRGFMAGFTGASDSHAFDGPGHDLAYFLSLLLALVLVVIVFLIMKKRVTDPVKKLSKSMERVREGDLDAAVEVVDSFEFGQIEKDFNAMVNGLREARNEREQNAEKNRKLYAEIAHDLKTPMTMILGYARLLSQGEVTKEQQKEYLETIVEQTENANALLEQMLEYAKLGSTEYRLDVKEGDLAECLRQTVAESYYRFEEKKMELEVEIPDEAVTCQFDEKQIRRVFFNLIGNVICHNPEGTRVKILMKDAKIMVADNGPLIEEELKERLFEPFQTGDESRGRSQGGSGLGLSVAKKIVMLHGGDLEYKEELVEGYKGFVLTLSSR